MQARHSDHDRYFEEAAVSCRTCYLPYLNRMTGIVPGRGFEVLEVGCGVGGNLSVFAERGCSVTGIDLHALCVERAGACFARRGLTGEFICGDVLAPPRCGSMI